MVRSRCANYAQILRYGEQLAKHLRDFAAATAYAPHQVYIGNIAPEKLSELPKPWFVKLIEGANPQGPVRRSRRSGSILCIAGGRGSVRSGHLGRKMVSRAGCALCDRTPPPRLASLPEVKTLCDKGALPLYAGERLVGAFQAGHEEDANLCRGSPAGKSRRQSHRCAFAARRAQGPRRQSRKRSTLSSAARKRRSATVTTEAAAISRRRSPKTSAAPMRRVATPRRFAPGRCTRWCTAPV